MKTVAILFSMFVVTLYLAAVPAEAQRGQGGQSGNSGRGSGGPMMQGGQGGADHRMGGPGMDRPAEMPPRQGKDAESQQPRMGRTERPGGEAAASKKPTLSDHLNRNTRLSSQLQGLLPEGTNLQEASTGFKNLGDFAAAAHVSHNLGIPFGDLKTTLTGGKNLGEAIHELRPSVDHKAEARKAQEQANKTLKESGSE